MRIKNVNGHYEVYIDGKFIGSCENNELKILLDEVEKQTCTKAWWNENIKRYQSKEIGTINKTKILFKKKGITTLSYLKAGVSVA